MQLHRHSIRLAAALLSAGMAGIYYLIGFGVLQVADLDPGESLLPFGLMAGSAFLLGTVLLVAFDRQVLWMLGAVLQVLVVAGYFAVAPDRTPHFEVWGIALRIIQLPLFAGLVYLALGRAPGEAAHPVRVRRR